MANRIPVKAIFTGSDVTSLGEFASGDTIDVSYIADGTITAAKLAADTATQAELDTVSGVASAALPKAGGTMTGTIAGFTSTGIDDNADATAITIDSSEDITFSKNRANAVSNVTLHNVSSTGFGTGIDFSCGYNGGYDLAKIDTENSSTGGQLRFYTSNTSGTITERMKINHSGNVGIGTNDPNSKVSIVGAGDNLSAISNNRDNYALGFTTASTSNYYSNSIGWSETEADTITSAIGNYDAGTTGGPTGLWFATGNTTTLSERMRIAQTGKVTINNSATTGTDTDTSNSGSVTLNFDINQNFVLTLTGNVTLDNPSTESVGQSGFIAFIQDGTGSRTVSLGTNYETAGAAGLTLTSTASATDLVPYLVVASGRILLGTPQLAFA